MQLLINDLSGYEKLTQEEECELFRNYRNGDRRALDTICRRCIFLVISSANAYKGQGVPIDDLVAAGNVGLLRAAEKFEPEKNFRFITYAIWYIRCEFLLIIQRQGQPICNKAHRNNPKCREKFEYLNIDHPSVNIPAKDENPTDEDIFRKAIGRTLTFLNDRDRMIISMYYGIHDGFNYNMKEIAGKLKLSQQYVNCRIHIARRELAKNKVFRELAISG